ncbi:hypothetical protein BJ741DRAFT_611395 [Chytriomyces cf. hyalinus JEL632]|nr:hypothetical protein BJ741DRAFT_611395 [Chytriomyces cf. hyalinus JEL632]
MSMPQSFITPLGPSGSLLRIRRKRRTASTSCTPASWNRSSGMAAAVETLMPVLTHLLHQRLVDRSSVALDQAYSSLKSAVKARDQMCLFCWRHLAPQAAPLFAQTSSDAVKDINDKHLTNAGLHSAYQVQNGVLLCANCHGAFGDLQQYIDVVDGCPDCQGCELDE